MIDLKLDPDTNDITLDGDDLALVTDDDATVQSLRIRLKFYLGEWFLAEDEGVPYFTEILIKQPNLVIVREWIRLTIVESPGIESLETLQLIYRNDRSLTVTFRANAGAIVIEEAVP